VKHFNHLPAMNDPTEPPQTPVQVVRPTATHTQATLLSTAAAQPIDPTPADAVDTAPLRIDYTTTRVMPEVWQRLRHTAGVMRNDRSALAETMKMLRNQLLLRLRADGHRLVAVSSPRAMHGKSLTALNLALAIAADLDSAVLLVDADLGGAGLQTLFGLADAPGLSDHLRRGMAIPDLLINPGVDRLVFLPAGQSVDNGSAELLAAKGLQQLMQTMKQRYTDRYIVVDLPPLLDSADALAFLPQVDTTLLVIEEHGSSVADIQASAELLAPFPLVGTVMSPRPPPTQAPASPRSWWPWRRRA
jgi:Mrp family chromosome partitioning ATPase